MQRVLEKYEKQEAVPFAMRYMEVPEERHTLQLNASASTHCSVYTTSSGPNSSPDDGQVLSPDD